MICPIINPEISNACVRQECCWWHEESYQCSIRVIAGGLYKEPASPEDTEIPEPKESQDQIEAK